MNSRFEVPSIKARGELARAVAAVQAHKPAVGEAKGTETCPRCRGRLTYTIDSRGNSRGMCAGACGVRWAN